MSTERDFAAIYARRKEAGDPWVGKPRPRRTWAEKRQDAVQAWDATAPLVTPQQLRKLVELCKEALEP